MGLKRLNKLDAEDFARVMETGHGARFMARLVDFCGVWNANPEASAFAEGMRNVGLWIFDQARPGMAALIKAGGERAGAFEREDGDDG